MSITTQKGDDGFCDMMYSRRVSKTDPRVVACGTIDELTAAMGVARVAVSRENVREALIGVQAELIVVMGELMTFEEDRERFLVDDSRRRLLEWWMG